MSAEHPSDVRSRESGKPLKVLLIDDHAVVRAGLRLLIEQQSDLRVCGAAASVEDAIALDCKPDIILLDLVLGHRARGQDVVVAATKSFRGVPVLALSMIDSLAVIDAVLAAGPAVTFSKTPRPTNWSGPSARSRRARNTCSRRSAPH
jgi:DNA-binding NarL/FixJ family response regulator